MIATSQEPLSVAGEHVVPVPPLRLPAPDGAEPLAQFRHNEAVALFRRAGGGGIGDISS